MIKVLPLKNKMKCEPCYQIRAAIMTEKYHNMDYNISTLGEKKYDIPFDIAEEMIQRDMGHYEYSEVGDCGTALRSKDGFYKVIEELKEVFDMKQWDFEIIDQN